MEKQKKGWEKLKALSGMDRMAMLIAIAAVVLVGIAVYPWFKPQPASEDTAPAAGASVQQLDDETRLARVLSSIDGAGRVDVMISYLTGPERVPISDVNRTTSDENTQDASGTNRSVTTVTEASKTVTVGQQGANEALVLVEKKPQVQGVIVVCEGARNIGVKLSVMDAVMTVLGVPAERVEVFPMQKQ